MTYVDWHRGIRKAYPDALLNISGDTLEDLVVINQETGEPFVFDQVLAEAAAIQARADDELASAQRNRATAYRNEADPLFFKAQRGEATIEEWQLKVAEIRSLYPYPNEEVTQ